MSSSQVLEVAVGLVFLYLLLSTACSGIKELIARGLDLRARTLEAAVRHMLADPKNVITTQILESHVIAGTVRPGTKPSYISSRNFALALFEFVAPVAEGQSLSVQDLKAEVSKLPPPFQKTFLGLLESGQTDVESARQRVENWYDDAMERVSGTYKRRAQFYIAVIGVLLCAALNADSLMIAKELWVDQALRTAIVEQAQVRAKQDQNNLACGDALQCTTKSIRDAAVPPIGWAGDDVRKAPTAWGWGWKVLGILITSAAVAMGAPFWFGLLNKLVNLRLTGNPPPDSRQAASS